MSTEQVAGDQLRAFCERIEKVQEFIDEFNADKTGIYNEAAGAGFDKKALREIVRLRKMDADERSEREALVDLYMGALGEAK
mgnify:FL=1